MLWLIIVIMLLLDISFNNRIIIQWGFTSLPSSSKLVTLPITYTTTFNPQATDGGSGTQPVGVYRGTSVTQFTIYYSNEPMAGRPFGCFWCTFGY